MVNLYTADEKETRYFIGLTIIDPRVQLPIKPCLKTSATFLFRDADLAGKALVLLAQHSTYGEAISTAVQTGYSYRSALYGEQQLNTLIRPGDYWACIMFNWTMKEITVASGGYSQINYDLITMSNKYLLIRNDPSNLVSQFYQAALNEIPSF